MNFNLPRDISIFNLIIKAIYGLQPESNIDVIGEAVMKVLQEQLKAKGYEGHVHIAWDNIKKELFLWA